MDYISYFHWLSSICLTEKKYEEKLCILFNSYRNNSLICSLVQCNEHMEVEKYMVRAWNRGTSWWAWAGKLPGETKPQIHVLGTYFRYLNHTFPLSILPINYFVLWVHLNINPLIASEASLPNFLMRILICAPKVCSTV